MCNIYIYVSFLDVCGCFYLNNMASILSIIIAEKTTEWSLTLYLDVLITLLRFPNYKNETFYTFSELFARVLSNAAYNQLVLIHRMLNI